jgi:hypothetical protein
MENYSSRYFYDDPEEQLVATNEAGLHAYTTGLLPETDVAREYCIEQYMARLGEMLQPVLSDVAQRVRYDSLKAYGKNATELRQALNAPLEFKIVEEISDGEKSKYAGCIIDICRPDALVDENWTAVLDKDGRAAIDATILGYMQAGIPTQLRLWNKGDDEFEDESMLTQTFKVMEKTTVIPLGGMRIDAAWFEGYWSQDPDDDPYLDVAIKILDEKTCAFYVGIMSRYTELDESKYYTCNYVFDPVEHTLVIENYKDFPNGVKLIACDQSQGQYGADFIQFRKGEDYQYSALGDVIRMK